jgi:hypothetical protein
VTDQRRARPRAHSGDVRQRPPPAAAPRQPDLSDDLLAVLKRMRLPYVRNASAEVLAIARAQTLALRGTPGAHRRAGPQPCRRDPTGAVQGRRTAGPETFKSCVNDTSP